MSCAKCDKCGVETTDLTGFSIPIQITGRTEVFGPILGRDKLNVCEKCAEKIGKMFSEGL